MLGFLKQWILQIVFLTLLITIFNILIPEGKIKKFFVLFTGFIVISAVLTPLIGIAKKSTQIDIPEVLYSNMLDKQEVLTTTKSLEQKQKDLIIKEYIKKINTNVATCIKGVQGISNISADTIVNENMETDEFGKIIKLYVYFSLTPERTNASETLNPSDNKSIEEIKNVEQVENIQIGKDKTNQTQNKGNTVVPEKTKNEIVSKLVKGFEVYEKDIVLKIK